MKLETALRIADGEIEAGEKDRQWAMSVMAGWIRRERAHKAREDGNPGWIITNDHLAEPDGIAGTNMNAVTVVGPSDYDGPTDIGALRVPFRMYDDDGTLYYEGRMNADALEAFGDGRDPLSGFGMPNAGATRLDYREASGAWTTA